MSVGWIANRNAPVATCLAALALLLHLRWRQDGRRGSGALAVLAFAGGLLGGEMAVTAVAYLAAYALCLDADRPRGRLLSLAPYAVVLIAWKIAYDVLGYGAHGSHFYVDPDHPLRFAGAVGSRLPLLLAAQLTPVPADLSSFLGPGSETGHLVAALALLAAIGAASWRWLAGRPAARFAAIAMVLSAVPLCSAGASNRLLLPISIGGGLLVAQFVTWVRERRQHRLPVGAPARALGIAFVVSHLILSPLLLPLRTLELGLYDRAYVQAARSLDRIDDCGDRTLVIVNGPDFFFTWWAPVFRFADGRSVPPRLRALGDAEGPVEVTRVDDRTLRLRAERGFAGHMLGPIVTDPDHPIGVGFTYVATDLTVVVLQLTADGRPRVIEARFGSPLEDDRRRFAVWTRDGFRPFALPAVGATVTTEAIERREAMRYQFR